MVYSLEEIIKIYDPYIGTDFGILIELLYSEYTLINVEVEKLTLNGNKPDVPTIATWNDYAGFIEVNGIIDDNSHDIKCINEMINLLVNGTELNPILLDKDSLYVVDGRHRACAYRTISRKYIPAFLPTKDSFEVSDADLIAIYTKLTKEISHADN